MDLHVRWHKPVALKEIRAGSDTPLIYDIDFDRIPETPGIYIFIRKYGKNQNPLYIGNRGIYLTPPDTTGCGLTSVANGAGPTCTAC